MDLIQSIHDWSRRKLDQRRIMHFGGIQTCPWCRQTANQGEDWSFTRWPRDEMLDVLTCGCCGGTSLWRFEIGMIYVSHLDPPRPAFDPAPFYDVEAARLTPPSRP